MTDIADREQEILSLDPEGVTSIAILIKFVDRKVMTLLRDGSIYIGFLRSFDQFGTIILHKTIERIHIGEEYGEIPLGIFLIRSENIVLIGEISFENEYPDNLKLIPKDDILRKKAELSQESTAAFGED